MLNHLIIIIQDSWAIIKTIFTKPNKDSILILKSKKNQIQDNDILLAGLFNSQTNQEEKIQALEDKVKELQEKYSQNIISSKFKYLFIIIFLLSIISLVIALFISFQHSLSNEQKELFSICITVFKGSVGAIIGLIGGKLT